MYITSLARSKKNKKLLNKIHFVTTTPFPSPKCILGPMEPDKNMHFFFEIANQLKNFGRKLNNVDFEFSVLLKLSNQIPFR